MSRPHGGSTLAICLMVAVVLAVAATVVPADPIHELSTFDFEALQLAVDDLSAEFGQDYPNGPSWSGQCRRLAAQSADTLTREPNNTALLDVLLQRARDLHGKALLANPLLNFNELILLKRKRGQLGLPDNHKCNSGIPRTGYDNEIAVLSPVGPSGRVRTLYAPSDRRFVGEIDLHWNAERLLFTMADSKSWRIHEIGADGNGLRQVSPDDHPDVDHFDACYLPNGRIAFASTASYHAVPCWHGVERACSIYAIDADGTAIRQLCFDQDLDLHPSVLPDGRITFSRWDYSGTMHIYLRPLMAMNPDGTGQRALYGSNSYWPNALYFPRGIPGSPNRIIAIVAGHHGVRLDRESWDRLITWIDLNGPCHGTWSDIAPVPEGTAQRRRQLAQLYGGPAEDPERIPQTSPPGLTPAAMTILETPPIHHTPPAIAPAAAQPTLQTKTVPLGNGLTMKLVRIPAGRFLMGSSDGLPDEQPPFPVTIDRDFWMGVCEVTNAQYALFDPAHNSGRFTKRFEGPDGPGLSLNGPDQPVVRVSWLGAMDFCHWLSDRTGETFSLPTEAQWEYTCRAGTTCPLSFGGIDTDFSAFANCADRALSIKPGPTGGLESSINLHFGKGILESTVGGLVVCDARFDDGAVAIAPVAHYHPSPWGLHDMHGNAAEWTATTYEPYTCNGATGDDPGSPITRKVVRGGSWYDRPARCRSAFRLAYPAWQPVHNTGFRVTCEVEPAAGGVSR